MTRTPLVCLLVLLSTLTKSTWSAPGLVEVAESGTDVAALEAVGHEVLTGNSLGGEEEKARTIVAITLVTVLLSVAKSLIKPVRNMYLTMGPELSAFKCLSESGTLDSLFGGYSRDQGYHYQNEDEGYTYDAPRHLTSDEDELPVLSRIPRFIDQVSSFLREGESGGCMMPYMRERVIRWLDG